MGSLTFVNPKSNEDRDHRNTLLAASLRDAPLSWNYASEYPLVLSPHADITSWCAFEGEHLVAHANLWPRSLRHVSGEKSIPVGLVGNVATDAAYRGRGHMSALVSHLAKLAEIQGLHAIVLWSDLFKFYQNLGFRSIGRECRLRICRSDRQRSTGIDWSDADKLTDGDLGSMLALRPKLEWTLDRSVDEFRTLLGIPDTNLFLRRKGSRIQSWILIGKGSDMRGVIHEWGALSPDELVTDIHALNQLLDLNELMLLAPGQLPQHWLNQLKQRASECSEFSMALARATGPHGKDALTAIARGFIWGLDSI